jgi:hypothetical protein
MLVPKPAHLELESRISSSLGHIHFHLHWWTVKIWDLAALTDCADNDLSH